MDFKETFTSFYQYNEVYFPFIIFGAIILGIALIGFFAYRADKKRTEKFRNFAMQRGYSFNDKPLVEESFEFLEKGHSKKYKNELSANKSGKSIRLLDFQFTTGGGKNSQTHRQTIAIIRLENHLPKFTLHPENFFHKIGQRFGMKDIDFPENKDFSDKFVLKGDDEQLIRKLFDTNILHFFSNFQDKHNLMVESNGDKFLLYHAERRLNPADIESFVQESLEIVNLFDK